jgi:hypothetical protein
MPHPWATVLMEVASMVHEQDRQTHTPVVSAVINQKAPGTPVLEQNDEWVVQCARYTKPQSP